MADKTMVIMRGNSAKAGTYPDEQGKKIAWPIGALHVKAAEDYAKQQGYEPLTLAVPGDYPQSADSDQSKAALKAFHDGDAVKAFYGFSGGGYNLHWMLEFLAKQEPQSLRRIERIVALGAPHKEGKSRFLP